jgi:hypothetical protein
MRGFVDSYDRCAPRPKPGTRWIWEPAGGRAWSVIEVVRSWWNGEEWWVETRTLVPDDYPRGRGIHWNEVGRFWEAVCGLYDSEAR